MKRFASLPVKAIRNNLLWAGIGMVALVATVIAVSVVLLSTGEGKRPPKPPPPAPYVPPLAFPASFFTGPLGAQNILPSKTSGALLGTWMPGVPGWTWEQQKELFLNRQSYIGRKYDLAHIHYGAPKGSCYSVAPLSDDRASWVKANGYPLVVSWTHGWTIGEVNAGLADACLANVGARLAAWGPLLLRIYWEFNGTWFNWSGTGPAHIQAWQRTVTKIGATNVGFVWSPASGQHRENTIASYPGDQWVDWVGVSAYNHQSGWCSKHVLGWCELRHLITQEPDFPATNERTVYDAFAAQKPYMLTEAGSVEGTAGRKGQWFVNAANQIPAEAPNVRGLLYFDQDVTATENRNWLLDTSQSSLDGWRALALDPFFNP